RAHGSEWVGPVPVRLRLQQLLAAILRCLPVAAVVDIANQLYGFVRTNPAGHLSTDSLQSAAGALYPGAESGSVEPAGWGCEQHAHVAILFLIRHGFALCAPIQPHAGAQAVRRICCAMGLRWQPDHQAAESLCSEPGRTGRRDPADDCYRGRTASRSAV